MYWNYTPVFYQTPPIIERGIVLNYFASLGKGGILIILCYCSKNGTVYGDAIFWILGIVLLAGYVVFVGSMR